MAQTHSTQTLLDYDQLFYLYDQACEAGNEKEMRQVIANKS